MSPSDPKDQPCSSPLASSLVWCCLSQLSLFSSLSCHLSSFLRPHLSCCFSFSPSHSFWVVQGWSRHPLSSQNSHLNSHCNQNTVEKIKFFLCSVCSCCGSICFLLSSYSYIDDTMCDIYSTLNYCGHLARAPSLHLPSPLLRNDHWFAGFPLHPENINIWWKASTDRLQH